VDNSEPETVYPIPRGYVSADPGRNRYVRKQGASMSLPPRLNPNYSHDITEQRRAYNVSGVLTDLAGIGLGAVMGAAAPVTIPLAAGGAALTGVMAAQELVHRRGSKK
jgi:hypothetical protein